MPDLNRENLPRRFGQAMLFNSGSRLVRMAMQTALIGAMGAYLPMQELSNALFVLLITEVGTTIVTRTFTQSLVNYYDKVDLYERSAFYLNFILSVCAGILSSVVFYFYLLSHGQINRDYNIIYIIFSVAIAPIITSLSILPHARFSSSSNFIPIVIAETVATFTSTILAIAVAYVSHSYISIVIYIIVQRITEVSVLSFYSPLIPRNQLSRHTIKAHLEFSTPLIATFLITSTLLSVDQIFVSFFYGPEPYALYGFARRITDQPVRLLMNALERSVIPSFVSLRSRLDLYRSFALRTFFICALISGSVFLPGSVLSNYIIIALLPERIHGSYEYILIFCIQSALLPVGSVLFSILVSVGNTKSIFIFTSTRLCGLVLSSIGVAYALSLNLAQFSIILVIFNLFMLIPNFKLANVAIRLSVKSAIISVVKGLFPGVMSLTSVLVLRVFHFNSDHERFLAEAATAAASLLVALVLVARTEVQAALSRMWKLT